MIIGFANDHAGFPLKTWLIKKLEERYPKCEIRDFGCHSTESADYPIYVKSLMNEMIGVSPQTFGIVICGSGNGVNITANKSSNKNVRSVLCWNPEVARLGRAHNHANVLAIPARFLEFEQAWEIVETFLNTQPENGRHLRRVNLIC